MADQAMNRDEVPALLREHKPVLAERFGVVGLSLFGARRSRRGSESR